MKPPGPSCVNSATMTRWSWPMTTSTHRTSVHERACECMDKNQCPSDLHVCVCRLRVSVGCTTELNHLGHQFLQKLFDKYDEVSSHIWSSNELCVIRGSSGWWLRLSSCRIRIQLSLPQSWRICLAFYPTCPGARRCTVTSPYQTTSTSHSMGTSASGCESKFEHCNTHLNRLFSGRWCIMKPKVMVFYVKKRL